MAKRQIHATTPDPYAKRLYCDKMKRPCVVHDINVCPACAASYTLTAGIRSTMNVTEVRR